MSCASNCFCWSKHFLRTKNSSDMKLKLILIFISVIWGAWQHYFSKSLNYFPNYPKSFLEAIVSEMRRVWGVVGGLAKPLRLALLLLLSGHPLTGITYTCWNFHQKYLYQLYFFTVHHMPINIIHSLYSSVNNFHQNW